MHIYEEREHMLATLGCTIDFRRKQLRSSVCDFSAEARLFHYFAAPDMEANVEEGVRATLGVTSRAGSKLVTPCAAKKCHHSCEGLWCLGLISPPSPRGGGEEKICFLNILSF